MKRLNEKIQLSSADTDVVALPVVEPSDATNVNVDCENGSFHAAKLAKILHLRVNKDNAARPLQLEQPKAAPGCVISVSDAKQVNIKENLIDDSPLLAKRKKFVDSTVLDSSCAGTTKVKKHTKSLIKTTVFGDEKISDSSSSASVNCSQVKQRKMIIRFGSGESFHPEEELSVLRKKISSESVTSREDNGQISIENCTENAHSESNGSDRSDECIHFSSFTFNLTNSAQKQMRASEEKRPLKVLSSFKDDDSYVDASSRGSVSKIDAEPIHDISSNSAFLNKPVCRHLLGEEEHREDSKESTCATSSGILELLEPQNTRLGKVSDSTFPRPLPKRQISMEGGGTHPQRIDERINLSFQPISDLIARFEVIREPGFNSLVQEKLLSTTH